MSANLKQSGSGISDLGPETLHDIPYLGEVTEDATNDEKSEKDRSPTDSETAVDRIGKDEDVGDDLVIRNGADASKHLLSLRDDEDPVLTFRSALLGTAFACFQAAMNQIYNVSHSNQFFMLNCSSNRPTHLCLGRLWSSSSTSSVNPGPSSYLGETVSKHDGELGIPTERDYRFTSSSPNSSIPILSVSKNMPSHRSLLRPPRKAL